MLALFRPGPLDSGMVEDFIKRKHGKEKVSYPHPAARAASSSETYGVIVYQEQVMQIAQVLAGYSLGDADNLRRAMGKKKPEEMAKERDRFLDGAVKQGIDGRASPASIFDQMETFAAYGFNKSHSAAYALITFQTAYLKAHYPDGVHGRAAVARDGRHRQDLQEHRRVPRARHPDPAARRQREPRATSPVAGERHPLRPRRGEGRRREGDRDHPRGARRGGPFTDLADFCQRVRGQQINRRVLESLDQVRRLRLARRIARRVALGRARLVRRPISTGSCSGRRWPAKPRARSRCSRSSSVAPPAAARRASPSGPTSSDSRAEQETVGFYITGHPLDKYERDLKRLTTAPIADLGTRTKVEKVKVGGVVHTLKLKNNKKGDRYATFNLEDKTGTIEIIVWPEAYQKYEMLIASDEPLCVSGHLEVSEERCQIIADDIGALAAAREKAVRELRLRLPENALTLERAHELARMLEAHPGSCATWIDVMADAYVASVRLPRFRVAASEQLIDAVERLFGSSVAHLQ